MTAPFDVTGVRLETERLILRPWLESDLPAFFAYTSDEAVEQGMGWERIESVEEAQEKFPVYRGDNESFALVLKETGRVIGDLSVQVRPWEIYPLNQNLRGRELGFGIRSGYWGRGLVPEAVQAVLNYCFDVLDFDFVTCGHFFGNEKSHRVIKKCGFTHLFDAPWTFSDGKIIDISTYIMYNPHKER